MAAVACSSPSERSEERTDAPASKDGDRAAWIADVQKRASIAYSAERAGGRVHLPNPLGGFGTEIANDGMLRLRRDANTRALEGRWRRVSTTQDVDLELRLVRFGVAEALEPAPNVDAMQVLDNRVELTRGRALTEWYVNGPLGLEQGFTVHAAPATPAPSSELVWELEVGSELRPVARAGAIAFADASSNIVARYGELYAHDASGTKLPTRMETAGATLRLVVEARGADYPLLVDPLIWIQRDFLYPADGQYQQGFGETLSLWGDIVAVGARWHDTETTIDPIVDDGAAYVFTPSEIEWFEQRLTASDGEAGDAFGAVAMSGDTLFVGAFGDDDAGLDSGSAYVFSPSGAIWTERQKLTASDATAGAGFGIAVAVDAGTALVGATGPPGGFSAPANGGAYVFVSSGSTWSEQQKLVPQIGATDEDAFGWSVSVSGTTAVIGAPYDDDAALDAGAAYVFVVSGGRWVEQQKLVAADAQAEDHFGYSVSISGDTAIVGAPLADGRGASSGAAYVFFRSASKWTQEQQLTASDGTTQGRFGQAVAVSGDIAAVGAYYSASGDSSAYVFGRTASVWSEQHKLFARDIRPAMLFGTGIAMRDMRIAVGAPGDVQAAFVFETTEPYLTGSPCPSGAFSCASGFCVDGYCCETACDGVCQTCADTLGTCTPVVQGTGDPDTCLRVCDGAGGCKGSTGANCVAGEECVGGFCSGGICCDTACTGGCETCSTSPGDCIVLGAGASSRDGACSPYLCTGASGECPSSCASDDDCESTHYCVADGTCQPRTAIGGSCEVTGAADCESAHSCRSCAAGQCADGYCCFSTCEGACEHCNAADLGWPNTANGTCATAPADVVVDEACTAERTPRPEPAVNSVDPTSSGCACRLTTPVPNRNGMAGVLLLALAGARRLSIVKRSQRGHAGNRKRG